jgi:hypothetical protein
METSMRIVKVIPLLIAVGLLSLNFSNATAQVVAVQDGSSLILKVTLTAQGVTASRSELLMVVKKLAPDLQLGYPQPIAQIQFVNPADGSVVATFSAADWQ